MLYHIAMFRFRDDVEASAIDDLRRRLLELPGKIDTVRTYSVGRDAGIRDTSWDMVVIAGFDDAAGYLAYADHPDHMPLVAEIGEIVEGRVALQTEEILGG